MKDACLRHVCQIILIASVVLGSWLGMQVVHELGHVLCAWATGAQVTAVILDPFTFSRTDVAGGRYPLLVAWGGPLGGATLPLAGWFAGQRRRWPGTYVLRFFAGFCLLAHGAYLGIGSFERAGDPGDIMRSGSPVWLLWLFALITMPAGFGLWHHLGSSLGLGPARGEVSRRMAWLCLIMVLAWTLGAAAFYHHTY